MWEILTFGPTGWGDDLMRAAWLTVQLALASLAIALPTGFALALMKLSYLRPLNWLATGYTLIIRGTPEFLILLLVFFGAEAILAALLARFELPPMQIPRFAAAVAGLGLIFAAYTCEVFRGAWQAVPVGQIEAAEGIALAPFTIFLRIRLPQLWRHALPGLGNLWLVLLKDTSLAAVLALDELMRVAKVAGEVTRLPLVTFAAAAVIYLALTAISDHGRDWLERRAQRGRA
jgi:His/Glu/Gln/Arg/opine family amino acid ABC transporter permease subunit